MSDNSEEKCPNYEGCEAALCPLAKESEKQIWFVDEDICSSSLFHDLCWVEMQRRIKKACKEGYFNIAMLVTLERPANGIPEGSNRSPESWIHEKLRERGIITE